MLQLDGMVELQIGVFQDCSLECSFRFDNNYRDDARKNWYDCAYDAIYARRVISIVACALNWSLVAEKKSI